MPIFSFNRLSESFALHSSARLLCGTILSLLAFALPSVQGEDQVTYNRDVRPILADKCFACHGADSAARKADLRLDRSQDAVESGAVAPGDLESSELIARITSEEEDLVMPPPEIKKPLSPEDIDILRRWIEQGAQYEAHWSFIAPAHATPPPVQNSQWVKNGIDNFVLAKLEHEGLSPSVEADAYSLFRRLHLDVTGLPPRPELVQRFVGEYEAGNDEVWAKWVDRLLESPRWGEHRARYWLDAARYADTHGLHFDNYREMWPYRDWVIRAFNANLPFDQFTIEQLAGDLLPEPTLDQLVATGLQRCNITTNEGGTIAEENLALYAADRVQTLGWVYLGLTTNCCQCHDHKFDSISMKDYYSLAAFFRNTTQGALDGNVSDGLGPAIRVPSPEDSARWRALPDEINLAKKARDNYKASAQGDYQNWLANFSGETGAIEVSRQDLVARGLLMEGSGDESLDLVSGNRFKSTGQVTWNPDGKFGPAPILKQGSTFEIGDVGDFEHAQSFSYGGWFKAANISSTGAMLARMNQGENFRGWDLWHENGSVAVHIIDAWPDNALKVVTRKPVLTAGTWHHVFATYDGSGKPSGIKIYVDGKRSPTNVTTETLKAEATIRTKTPLRIGQRSRDQGFEGGSAQDIYVYARALSKSEVKLLASSTPIRELLKLAKSPEGGTAAGSQTALFQYFLTNVDSKHPLLEKTIRDLEAERVAIESRSPFTHVQREKPESPPMANILMRGEYDRVGDAVQAATPSMLPPMPDGVPANRMGLAKWVVSPNHPLTARVTVNRFWQQLFGRGIVATPEDFGVSGAMPSHPELLDWLAIEFRDAGWDVKKLFRQMFLSATYRQSSAVTQEKLAKDELNILLSRGPRFRMDAEMVRDYALAASGLLTDDLFGPPVRPYQPEGIWDVVGLPGGDTREYKQSHGHDLYRRSMYTFWKRMAPPPNLELFNAPSREVCSVRRERTNTPIQALVTLNDPQFVEAARVLATRALTGAIDTQGQTNDDRALDTIASAVLGRPLSIAEQAMVLAGKDQLLAYYESNPEDASQLVKVGEFPVDEQLDKKLLAAWTVVCNQLLNLDEALNK